MGLLDGIIPFLGITLACVHARITFAVVRDILLQGKERRAHAGQTVRPEADLSWQESRQIDQRILAIAWGVALADLILLIGLCVQGAIVTIFVTIVAYLGLFFLAYFTQHFEQGKSHADIPASQARELRSLRTGARTSIIDTWLMRTWELNAGELRTHVRELAVDPNTRVLTIKVQSSLDGSAMSADRHAQYAFLHDVGELLLAMTHEPWMQPYRAYFSALDLEVWGERLSEAGHPLPYRMLHLKGSATKLGDMHRHGWDVMRLDKLFHVEFGNGEAV